MANEKEITSEEEASLDADLSTAELDQDAILSAADLGAGEEKPKADEPEMSDPKWPEFVMRQFTEEELDPNGRPFVYGLRRVARLLLGPILGSHANVVQAPSMLGGHEKTTLMQPAVVQYTVNIMMCRLEHGMSAAYETAFTDAADVHFGNTDPDFLRHATATAATRAEARCLRKALQLTNIAAEEQTLVPLEEASVDGMIPQSTIDFIDMLCQRNNINVLKFIKAGKEKKYERIKDVPFGAAQKMVEYLSVLQNERSKIDKAWLGYDPDWRKK